MRVRSLFPLARRAPPRRPARALCARARASRATAARRAQLSLCSFTNRDAVFALLKERLAVVNQVSAQAPAHPAPATSAGAARDGGDDAHERERTTAPVASAGAGSPGRQPAMPAPTAPVSSAGAEPPARRLASSPPNSSSVLTQRLRDAVNCVLGRAIRGPGPLTAADEAEACLRLLVAIEAVLEHGLAPRGRFGYTRRPHAWHVLEQLELLGGDAASGVAAARAAGASSGGDAECAHAWLCWCCLLYTSPSPRD